MRIQNLEFAILAKDEHAIIPIGYNATKLGLLRFWANCCEQDMIRIEPKLFIKPVTKKRRKNIIL